MDDRGLGIALPRLIEETTRDAAGVAVEIGEEEAP
jgi:hypothetical protein